MSLSNHSSPISLSNPLKTSESRGKNFISSHLPPEKKERRGEKKDDTKQRPIATDTMALVKSTISVDVSPRLISNVDERERERQRKKERKRYEAREDRRIRREESVRYNTSICVRASVFPRCLAARADFARATLYRPWPGYDTNRWCWRSTERHSLKRHRWSSSPESWSWLVI